MPRVIVALLFFAVAISTQAQSLETEHTQVREILDSIYSFNFTSAERLIGKILKNNPSKKFLDYQHLRLANIPTPSSPKADTYFKKILELQQVTAKYRNDSYFNTSSHPLPAEYPVYLNDLCKALRFT